MADKSPIPFYTTKNMRVLVTMNPTNEKPGPSFAEVTQIINEQGGNLVELFKAVLEYLPLEEGCEISTFEDVTRHGAQAGFGAFIYYNDTNQFYDDNEEVIWNILEELAEDFGHSGPLEMIGSFNGSNDVFDLKTFKNLLAWFALEHVAAEVVNIAEGVE